MTAPERTETAGPFIKGPECPNCPHQMTFHTRQGKCHATISGAACPCASTERTETAGIAEVLAEHSYVGIVYDDWRCKCGERIGSRVGMSVEVAAHTHWVHQAAVLEPLITAREKAAVEKALDEVERLVKDEPGRCKGQFHLRKHRIVQIVREVREGVSGDAD